MIYVVISLELVTIAILAGGIWYIRQFVRRTGKEIEAALEEVDSAAAGVTAFLEQTKTAARSLLSGMFSPDQ